MPYKTPFGDHYHVKLGCSGAFIPCGTSGLEPCSVCCGGDAGSGGSASGGSTRRVAGGSGRQAGGSRSASTKASAGSPAQRFISKVGQQISPDDLASDESGEVRLQVVQQIEDEITRFPEGDQREKYREQLQMAWNEEHPDRPILVWSKLRKEDRWYNTDTPTAVILTHRGGRYRIYEKATGIDCTDAVHHDDFMVRLIEYQIKYPDGKDTIEYLFDNEESWIAARRVDAYTAWLTQKRRESSEYKYHKGADGNNLKIRYEVYHEFLTETQYQDLSHDDYEKAKTNQENAHQAALQRFHKQLQAAQQKLAATKTKYYITDDNLLDIRVQYRVNFHDPDRPEYDPVSGKTIDCTLTKFARF